MTKFMVNNRADAWKTDVNLLSNTPILVYNKSVSQAQAGL